MAEHENESFAEFCARQKAGLQLISEAEQQENDYQKALKETQEKRYESRYRLFYDNLDLILRHKDEILATPRYANIDAHYLLKGGGLYVGHLNMARQFNIAGNIITVNLRLASLFKIWGSDQFRVECECDTTTFIRGFAGSPLSGSSQASAICPKCKKIVQGKSARWFTVGDAFKNDGEICELETMINELRLKEFNASASIE